MPATRLMPTEEGQDLIDLTREICDKELRPRVDDAERAAATTPQLPRDAFRTLGRAGLLSLPYPEEFGGGAQPYEVYLQVVEEIASAWMSVAVGVSVHG
ncbi:MAG TPA: acyl-CoA dehydrogenase family protein, partial [Pedococcus sp.]|nr:acyl-CoA dehydrogenase family protein [Pedococcus sp.]